MSAIATPDHQPMEVAAGDRFRLCLLGTWTLSRNGVEIRVATNRQRLIALLALMGPQNRAFVAGTLWPDSSDSQAQANLRSTLSRLQMSGLNVVESVGDLLRLSPLVDVDVRELMGCAEAMVHSPLNQAPSPGTVLRLQHGGELLAGWYDEWVEPHRERLRQLRLHALEIVAAVLSKAERYAEALEAALRSVDLEPLRESAHRTVTLVHLAEGNHVEAIRHFYRYRNMLLGELGIEPSDRMLRLVQPWLVNDGSPYRRRGSSGMDRADRAERRAG